MRKDNAHQKKLKMRRLGDNSSSEDLGVTAGVSSLAPCKKSGITCMHAIQALRDQGREDLCNSQVSQARQISMPLVQGRPCFKYDGE